jgi:hypothetical protein
VGAFIEFYMRWGRGRHFFVEFLGLVCQKGLEDFRILCVWWIVRVGIVVGFGGFRGGFGRIL